MISPILDIQNLSKSFGSLKAVNQLSFQVNEGDVFGFLGPNGAGKSTTIRMMLNLIRPDVGDIFIAGQSVSKKQNKALTHIGALVEEPDFYKHLSAKKNLEMLARMENVDLKRVDEVLEWVGLDDRAEDKVKAYSHGMKQRLGIAQALLKSPKLLVLDEPTSGLDPKRMKQIRDLILDLKDQGITIFLSSHLLHEVELVCTSVAIVNHGRLKKIGSLHDLMDDGRGVSLSITVNDAEAAIGVLSERNDIRDLTLSKQEILLWTNNDSLADINRVLVENNISVTRFLPRTSLEEYYLSVISEDEI
ncbi:MAG: ATP-binding cassette domain-containing protein [Candidatus Marinimicrobia bacterium]|nr:ATP-binding cassette domain-containing protein [Candidatus Neomarinimicrobiota bacterium]